MKKLLSIMLCLMLLLSGLALAESDALPELYTIDFGYFTMGLTANDTYRVAAERQDNTAYAIIYPNYDAANPSPSNINVSGPARISPCTSSSSAQVFTPRACCRAPRISTSRWASP